MFREPPTTWIIIDHHQHYDITALDCLIGQFHQTPTGHNSYILSPDGNLTMMNFKNLGAFIVCSRGLYNTCQLDLPIHLVKGGQFQFLTNLSILLTTVYYGLAMVAEVITVPYLRYLHRVCLDVEFVVTVVYFSLYFYFPHLLNSINVALVVDLQIHLFPYLLLVWSPRDPRVHRSMVHICIILYLVGYWTYIEWIYYGDDHFTYPFLTAVSLGHRLKWLLGFIVSSCGHDVIYASI